MTNRELIQKLLTFPMEAPVVIRMFSECRDLDKEEPRLIQAAERKMILHWGTYMIWEESYKKPNDPDPEFVTVIHFPGN